MNNTYLWADSHWGHSKVIQYCNRPFDSVEEMNETLLTNYNNLISEDDTVYWLGDLALNIIAEEERLLYPRFKGNKVLILGNHDKRSHTFYLDSGFSEVHKSLTINYKDYNFLLTHIPNHPQWYSKNPNWKPIRVEGENVVNLCGHLHDTFQSSILDKSKYFCVSVENINYTPIDIERIYKIMQYKNNYIPDIRAGIGIEKLADDQFKKIFGFSKQ